MRCVIVSEEGDFSIHVPALQAVRLGDLLMKLKAITSVQLATGHRVWVNWTAEGDEIRVTVTIPDRDDLPKHISPEIAAELDVIRGELAR